MSEAVKKCRTCLKEETNQIVMVPLSSKYSAYEKVMPFSELITLCSSVQINIGDKYPQYICTDCVQSAENCYAFRLLCEQSEKKLRELNIDIKIEQIFVDESALTVKMEYDEGVCDRIKDEIDNVEESMCYLCNVALPTKEALVGHVSNHNEQPKIECVSCDSRTPDKFIQDNPAKKSRRKRPKNRSWIKIRDFSSALEAEAYVRSQHIWKRSSSKTILEGHKIEYRCTKGQYRTNECPAGLYLLHFATNNKVSMYCTERSHDNHIESSRGLSHEIKMFVKELFDDGIQKPNAILTALRHKNMWEPPKTKLVNYLKILRVEKYGTTIAGREMQWNETEENNYGR